MAERRLRLAAALLLVLALAGGVAMLLRGGNATDARDALTIGESALARGDYSAARAAARDATAATPRSAAAQLLLARAALKLGDGVAGEAGLGRARDAGAPTAVLHGLRAEALLLQGDTDGALAEAARAPARDPDALRTRARAWASQGRPDDAGVLLATYLAGSPRDAAAWLDLGRIRLAAGDTGGALAAAARGAALAPGDPAALTLQGELVRQRYGLVASLPWFEAALRRDAGYHPALIEYAATLGDAGRHAAMLAATRRALAIRPGSPQAFYLQAVLAARAGKTALARGLLTRAGGAVSAIPAAQLLDGLLDLDAGEREQAIQDWRGLLARQPANTVVRRLLARALIGAGDAAGAADALAPIVARPDADGYALTLAARAAEAQGDRTRAAALLDRAAAGRGGRILRRLRSDHLPIRGLALESSGSAYPLTYVLGQHFSISRQCCPE